MIVVAHHALWAIGIGNATARTANTPHASHTPLALVIALARLADAPVAGMSAGRKADSRQCKGGEPDAESLQRRAAGDGLGHALGQFIELLIHNFPFVLVSQLGSRHNRACFSRKCPVLIERAD
jgi:hypothetical protein